MGVTERRDRLEETEEDEPPWGICAGMGMMNGAGVELNIL